MISEKTSVCPLCDELISDNITECPRCGATFATGDFVCGNCGSTMGPSQLVCRICGMDYGRKDYSCPLCNMPVSKDAIICPNCNAEFAEEDYKCSSCGAKISATATKCNSCGVIFIEEKLIEETGEESKVEEKKSTTESGKLRSRRIVFPFPALVGQEDMKRALLLNTINPEIGGVLLRGERGCGKSVAVRGLVEILPPIEVVEGCRFSCDPNNPQSLCWECRERLGKEGALPKTTRPIRVVDLPLNATEDRVVGSIDIDKILSEGLKSFQQGILAEANRGILYIDEINLLDDFLVDVLLDAAAMGICTVEREAISVSYPAKFIIVGSMNPEEGGLRPQLLDRIALVVEIKGLTDIALRRQIVKVREEADTDIIAFRKKYDAVNKRLREKIIRARALLPRVRITDEYLDAISHISVEFRVDGHRPDIMMRRTAATNAAYEGRDVIVKEDLIVAGKYVLPHRIKKGALEVEEFSEERLIATINAYVS